MSSFAKRWGSAIVLSLLLAIGCFLRVKGASTRSLDYDEIYLLTRSVLGLPMTDGPLAPFLLGYFLRLSDVSGEMLFWWSGLMGTAAIAAFYALGLSFSGSRLFALACASFITFSPLSIFLGQKGRPYSLLLFVMCLMYLSFFRAWQKPSRSRWVMYAIAASLAAATHLVAVPVLVALSGAAIGIRIFWRRLALAVPPTGHTVALVVGLSFLASLVGLVDLHSEESNLMLTSRLSKYREGLLPFLRSLVDGLSSADQVHSGPMSYEDGVAAVFVCLAGYGLFRLLAKKRGDLAVFLLSCLVVPSLVMFLTLGCMIDGWAWLRYVSHLVAPFGLLVVYGLNELFQGWSTKPRRAAVMAVLIIFAFPIASIMAQLRLAKDSWRGHGMWFKEFMAHPPANVGVPIRGYVTFLDRTADLLWFNSLDRAAGPSIILLRGGVAGRKAFWQQEIRLPPRSVVVPTYVADDRRQIEPGLYAVIGFFARGWRLPECAQLAPHLSSQLQVRDRSELAPPRWSQGTNQPPFARLCEVYPKDLEPPTYQGN